MAHAQNRVFCGDDRTDWNRPIPYAVLIAVIVSLMERLGRQYRPKDEMLLRDGELSDWAKSGLTSTTVMTVVHRDY